MNRIPYPLNDGGAICSYHAVKGYVDAECEVTCLAMNTVKHYIKLEDTEGAFEGVKKMVVIAVDNRIKALGLLKNLFSRRSYVTDRFISEDYRQSLVKLLREHPFDIIHLDGISSCLYVDTIRQNSTAKIIYRAHNVEYMLWQRASEADTNLLKSLYVGIQAQRLKRFEARAMEKVDTVLTISHEDEAFIHRLAPRAKTFFFPAGIDIDASIAAVEPRDLSLFFIGALDWLPNLQGLDWFLKDVWPAVHASFPSLKFHIAGKKMPGHFNNYESMNIVAHGEVASSSAFMNSYSVLVSPLVSGSGVRIKIIEAMAMGKVILSTSVSAEGSGAVDGEHILIANTTDEYISQIKRLLSEPELLPRISQNARIYALEHFQNKNIMTRLIAYYKEICK